MSELIGHLEDPLAEIHYLGTQLHGLEWLEELPNFIQASRDGRQLFFRVKPRWDISKPPFPHNPRWNDQATYLSRLLSAYMERVTGNAQWFDVKLVYEKLLTAIAEFDVHQPQTYLTLTDGPPRLAFKYRGLSLTVTERRAQSWFDALTAEGNYAGVLAYNGVPYCAEVTYLHRRTNPLFGEQVTLRQLFTAEQLGVALTAGVSARLGEFSRDEVEFRVITNHAALLEALRPSPEA